MDLMELLTRRPAWVVAVATIVGVTATANLGAWQLRRAEQKLALQRSLDERRSLPELPQSELARSTEQAVAQHYRRIRLQGRWLADRTVWLDNRQMNGRPGFIVVTPLALARSSTAVLVQRGWAPRNLAERTKLPAVSTPPGDVVIAGHIAPPPSRLFEFESAASGTIRQNLDLTAYARETGLTLAPLSVVQDEATPGFDDGLLREWPRPELNLHTHYGYAVQWFAMSALMAGLYVWFQLVRPRLSRRA
jgi:surfeit locus 1 family protein